LNERVTSEARRLDGSVDVRLAREVGHLETTMGELVRIRERGPDQVLDPCSASGLDGGSGYLELACLYLWFPEVGDDECPMGAVESRTQAVRLEEIRLDELDAAGGERPRRVACWVARRGAPLDLA
jgi:hypothetical protein